MSYLLELAARNRLRVDKSWWAIHAVSLSSLMSVFKERWVVTGIVVLAGLLTFVVRLHDI